MTLTMRKILVLTIVGAIFVAGDALAITHWLAERGVIDAANSVRREFLTGTAITVIVALLILLTSSRAAGRTLLRRCDVCGHGTIGRGRYCSDCGSRL